MSPCLVEENTISQNQSQRGGGVAITPTSNAHFINNLVTDNVATDMGGGLVIGGRSDAIIKNNLFARNQAVHSGGGLVIFDGSSPQIINNTIFSNQAPASWGGGIRVDSSSPTIMNTIIVGHTTSEGISAFNSQVFNSYNGFWNNQYRFPGRLPRAGLYSCRSPYLAIARPMIFIF